MINPVILVVEDEKLTREGIAETLKRWGCKTVHTASNGRDGLLVIKEVGAANLSLLLTDVRMPMMDGLELLAELERNQIAIPTIVVSAHSDFGYAQKAIHYGVVEYIVKPLDPAQLIRAVEKALGPQPTAKPREIDLPEVLQNSEFVEVLQNVWTPSIRQAVDYLMANYARAPGVREVSDAVGLNSSYFCTLFKEKTGYTFSDFLLELRMWHAKKLLLTTDQKVYEVAEALGYTTARYFAKAFHDAVGLAPLEFRTKYRV